MRIDELKNAASVPELIIALAPYMEWARENEREVIELRKKVNCGAPEIEEIFASAGWKLTQSEDGKWSYKIPMQDGSTGGSGEETLREAAVEALLRTTEMVFGEDEED